MKYKTNIIGKNASIMTKLDARTAKVMSKNNKTNKN